MPQKIRYGYPLGENIRKYRIKSHMTQPDLVREMQLLGCQISRETLAKIESGIANVKVEDLKALTIIFHCDYNCLFSEVILLQDTS